MRPWPRSRGRNAGSTTADRRQQPKPREQANSNAVLLKLDHGSNQRFRLFIDINAFPSGMRKTLRNVHVGCKFGTLPSKSSSYGSTLYNVGNPNISGIYFRPSYIPSSIARAVRSLQSKTQAASTLRDEQKLNDFMVAWNASHSGSAKLKHPILTYSTYNANPTTDEIYVSSSTSSVSQGGIARGVMPASGMQFRVMASTRYCDVNAYAKGTRIYTGDHLGETGGLQWAYGQFFWPRTSKRAPEATGMYGWMPMGALKNAFNEPPPEALMPDGSPRCSSTR